MASPTSRTLERLRKEGWTAQVVERWNPHARLRQDLFGFIDVVAIREGETLGVQATTTSNQSKRIAKIRETPHAELWLAAGNRIEVWGWCKRKVKPGGKRSTWQVTITPLTAANAAARERREE